MRADSTRYRLDHDESEHKSPSSAGSAVMGGSACNGWRFWSVEGDELARPEPRVKAEKTVETSGKAKSKPKVLKQIRRVPNQRGVPDGQAKWFCSSCMRSFVAAATEPTACPEGHPAEVEDELATTT